MKKPGLIGGIGPESSIEYYRTIIKCFREKAKTDDYPEILMLSINMTEMLNRVFNKQYDQLVDFLSSKIRILEDAGADFAVLASNTPHIVFKELKEKVNIPMISIVDAAIERIKHSGIEKTALFGTKSTMTGDFYKQAAQNYGIEVVIPGTEDMEFIHSKYMSELIFNNIVPETKKKLIAIVSALKQSTSIEGLILGGTELPLILDQTDFKDIQLFDTTTIHVETIVDAMLKK